MSAPPQISRQHNRFRGPIERANNRSNKPQSNQRMIHGTNQSCLDIIVRQAAQSRVNGRKRPALPLLVHHYLRILQRQLRTNFLGPSPKHHARNSNPWMPRSRQQMLNERQTMVWNQRLGATHPARFTSRKNQRRNHEGFTQDSNLR